MIDVEAQLNIILRQYLSPYATLLGSTNNNFGEYSQDFLYFLETNFRERKSSYQVNISYYLYLNDYNSSIGTFFI